MSSPAAAPTPGTQPSAGKEPSKAPPRSAANGTNPSTPAAHPTPSSMGQINFLSPTAGRVAGKTLGKTLAGHHSSPAVSSGTPTLNNLASTFDSPAFVGMEPGSSSMGFSMSGLGLGMGLSTSALGASSMGKLDDAERRRRLEAVLTALSKRTGRVSQEGLERLARKHGMDMYMETSREERVMTIASGAYAIDVCRCLYCCSGSPADTVADHIPSEDVFQGEPFGSPVSRPMRSSQRSRSRGRQHPPQRP